MGKEGETQRGSWRLLSRVSPSARRSARRAAGASASRRRARTGPVGGLSAELGTLPVTAPRRSALAHRGTATQPSTARLRAPGLTSPRRPGRRVREQPGRGRADQPSVTPPPRHREGGLGNPLSVVTSGFPGRRWSCCKSDQVAVRPPQRSRPRRHALF